LIHIDHIFWEFAEYAVNELFGPQDIHKKIHILWIRMWIGGFICLI